MKADTVKAGTVKSAGSLRVRRLLGASVAFATIVGGAAGVAVNASAASGSDTLRSGEGLANEQFLRSGNGFSFVMQRDGNGVIYRDGGSGRTAIWSSRTPGRYGSHIRMQTDGNLVMYDARGPYWSSRTAGRPGSYLVMQADGNLVMYQPLGGGSRRAVWASNTSQAAPTPTPGTAPSPAPGAFRPFSTCPVPGAKARGPYGANFTFMDEWNVMSAGTGARHAAVDMFAPVNTRIVAPANGIVFKVGTTSRGDRRLWIKLDSGSFVFMNHLNSWDPSVVKATSFSVSGGVRVRAGQTIGTVGVPSNKSRPHLHLHVNTKGPDAEYYQASSNVYSNLVSVCGR